RASITPKPVLREPGSIPSIAGMGAGAQGVAGGSVSLIGGYVQAFGVSCTSQASGYTRRAAGAPRAARREALTCKGGNLVTCNLQPATCTLQPATCNSDQHQIIPVDQLVIVPIAEDLGDAGAALAQDPGGFLGAVVDQAPGDLASVFVAAGHQFAPGEVAADGLDPHRQQAAALLAKHVHGAGVKGQAAAHLELA